MKSATRTAVSSARKGTTSPLKPPKTYLSSYTRVSVAILRFYNRAHNKEQRTGTVKMFKDAATPERVKPGVSLWKIIEERSRTVQRAHPKLFSRKTIKEIMGYAGDLLARARHGLSRATCAIKFI